MACSCSLLKPGGRAAVIVPDGVAFGSQQGHKNCAATLVYDHFLERGSLTRAGVPPLCRREHGDPAVTKTGRGGTDQVCVLRT